MHGSVEVVAYSGYDGGLVMIAIEDLVGAINEIVSVFKIVFLL